MHILDDHLTQILELLNGERSMIDVPQLAPLSSGCVPLLDQHFFPWGALPYPKEHAELGVLLCQLSDKKMREIASQMARYQEATLDHSLKPLFALFQQEGAYTRHELEKANQEFFDALQYNPADCIDFVDHELGLIAKRNKNTTVLSVGTGCKSGCGAFLCADAGIVNFGPQLHPLGRYDGFGIAGRAQNLRIEDAKDIFKHSYCCRIAAPSPRQTGLLRLKDSGYSGLWLEAEAEGSFSGLSLHFSVQGVHPPSRCLFSFFGKGEACYVSGSHKLKPRSLDRYHGPAQTLFFAGNTSAVKLEATEGISQMEVVPLAGDDNFWGADFLATYTITSPEIIFMITAS